MSAGNACSLPYRMFPNDKVMFDNADFRFSKFVSRLSSVNTGNEWVKMLHTQYTRAVRL